jgi:hypothetical protein
VKIGVIHKVGLVAAALGLAAIGQTSAFAAPKQDARAPNAKVDAKKEAAAATPDGPSSPFDDKAPNYPTRGDLPNLMQIDFTQLGGLLYAHLLAEADPARSGLIIEAALQRASKPCQQISAFQIYRYRTGFRTLKVKCPGKPLYVITVGTTGGVQISGGDGTIPELEASDGRIYSLFGREIKIPKPQDPTPLTPGATPTSIPTAQTAPETTIVPLPAKPVSIANSPALASQPVGTDAQIEPGSHRFRSWMLVINGVGISLLLVALWAWLRARRRRADILDYGLSSDDKDMLLDESREIYPNIFQHPQGFLISRGRRGKRRLFRGTFAAILYRDFGVKIGEIRI